MATSHDPGAAQSPDTTPEAERASANSSLPALRASDASSNMTPPVSAMVELIEVDKAKLEAAKLKTATWDHYIGFFTFKASGLTAIAAAASELLNPALIPIVLDPLSAAAAGIALLTGKSVLGLIAKVTAPDNKEPK